MMKTLKALGLVFILVLVGAGCKKVDNYYDASSNINQPAAEVSNEETVQIPESVVREFSTPTSRASERITKKPFGIKVSPQNSPVQPEKFTGYHAGVDFEVFPEEETTDVPISAVCTGKLATKRTATGYGGLVTQQCTLSGEAVTIIYGHIRLSSVTAKVGDELKAGQQFAVLGSGFSTETSGERKHLHLGIVKGHGSDIRGYVQQPELLGAFLDVSKYF